MKMRNIAAALVLAALASRAGAFAMPEGTYRLTGYNRAEAKEPSYRGHVFITRSGANYALVWKIGDRQTQKGVAILTGDVLSVGYFDMSGRDAGVVSYRLVRDGALDGYWAPLGSKGRGREVLVWTSAEALLEDDGKKT